MRLSVWAWLALDSLLLPQASGAVRPHYGGTLNVDLSTPWTTLDSNIIDTALSIPVAETLVRVNSRGEMEPVLAVAWQHDPDFKRWRFELRPKVSFHDGEALTAASAVPSLLAVLRPQYTDISIEAGGQALAIEYDHAMPDLLDQLAAPAAAIVRKSDANPLIGTGPFRVTAWEPGHRLTLAAFDDYWGGRPYLDSVVIEFGAAHVHADVFDIPAGPARRILPENIAIWSSQPRTLVAITTSNLNPAVVQALALTLDRAPIVNVLAQHKADAAYGLLPAWLSGYEFLFQSPPDVARARQLISQVRLATITLSYPPNDPFLRSVADRVALNARDAGITIQPTPNPNGSLRLVEWPLESTAAVDELTRMAQRLGAGDHARQLDSAKPETLYDLERSILDEHQIIPLVYLRETFGIAPRVHFQPPPDPFALHVENAWVDQRAQP